MCGSLPAVFVILLSNRADGEGFWAEQVAVSSFFFCLHSLPAQLISSDSPDFQVQAKAQE